VRRSVSAAIREPAGLIAQKIRVEQPAFVAQARIAIGFRLHNQSMARFANSGIATSRSTTDIVNSFISAALLTLNNMNKSLHR